MRSRSASRHASSCGESTSTPSTSKTAPWNPVAICAPFGLEREAAPVSGAQLADVVSHANPYRPAGALGLGRDGELARRKGHPQRRAAELHRKREPVEAIRQARLEVQ